MADSAKFGVSISVEDKSPEVLAALENAALRWLNSAGMIVTEHAADNLRKNGSVDTGRLLNSLKHTVVDAEKTAYAGSDVEYSVYVECGTGKYYPGGRPTPWIYQDAKGNWHWTAGNPAKPFLKPAIADHVQELKNELVKSLENA